MSQTVDFVLRSGTAFIVQESKIQNLKSKIHLSPSILAADQMRLGELVAQAEAAGADSIHIDVMDGRYVANFAFSPKTVADLRRVTYLPLHVHLEVADPDASIPLFAGADLIVVQEGCVPNLSLTLAAIKAQGCLAGVAVNPSRPVEELAEFLPQIDLLLIMAVEPGFGGQSFDRRALDKAAWAKIHRAQHGLTFPIGLDGGVGEETVADAAAAGVDFLIVGTGIFDVNPTGAAEAERVAANIRHLRQLSDL